jgi:hypothetical protein
LGGCVLRTNSDAYVFNVNENISSFARQMVGGKPQQFFLKFKSCIPAIARGADMGVIVDKIQKY